MKVSFYEKLYSVFHQILSVLHEYFILEHFSAKIRTYHLDSVEVGNFLTS
jgi:hypothetical protein